MKRGRIILMFAGRFPGEKAASIFVAREAESFAARGYETIVLAPRRLGRIEEGVEGYSVQYVPAIDLIRIPLLSRFAGYVNTAFFAITAYLWFFRHGRTDDIVLSNEALPLLFVSYTARTCLYELHDFPEKTLFLYRALFRRVRFVIATNEWKANALSVRFGVPKERVILERNAADIRVFGHMHKEKARMYLGIGEETHVMYTGQLYPWKGADTLASVAESLPSLRFAFIGGVGRDLEEFRDRWGHVRNIGIMGQVSHNEVPLWQAAADILVLPNSAKEQISEKYTSPMKLFEYMASSRPIVASDVSSIREVVSEREVYFARADDPQSFADAITRILANSDEAKEKVARAREIAREHSWDARARRLSAIFEKM